MTILKQRKAMWEAAVEAERHERKMLELAVREARKTMTLAVIAQELGVSRERVRQISETKEQR